MTTKIKLSGLTCQSCQKLIEMIILEIPGVSGAKVDMNSAEITADRGISLEEVNKALADTHYKAYE